MPDTTTDYLTLEQFPHLMTYLEASVCGSFFGEEVHNDMRNFFLDQVREHLRSKTEDEGEIQRQCRIAEDMYYKKRLAMVADSDNLGIDVRILARIAAEGASGTASAIAQATL